MVWRKRCRVTDARELDGQELGRCVFEEALTAGENVVLPALDVDLHKSNGAAEIKVI